MLYQYRYLTIGLAVLALGAFASYVVACGNYCAHTKASDWQDASYDSLEQECEQGGTIGATVSGTGTIEPDIDFTTHFTAGDCYVSYVYTPERWTNVEDAGEANTKTTDITVHGSSYSGGGCLWHVNILQGYWTCKEGTTEETDLLSKWTMDC